MLKMNKNLPALLALGVFVAPAIALADEAAQPFEEATPVAAPEPTPAAPAAEAPPLPEAPAAKEPKLHFEGGLVYAMPAGDIKQLVGDSTGVQVSLGYSLNKTFSFFGRVRHIRVSVKDEVTMGADVEASHTDLQTGVRAQLAVSPTMKLFAELSIGFANVPVTINGQDAGGSGAQFGARLGGIYMVSPKIGIGAALSSTQAQVRVADPNGNDGEKMDVDDDWQGLEGFVSVQF